MALLERVSTLLRANLNDLVEKAEDPERPNWRWKRATTTWLAPPWSAP